MCRKVLIAVGLLCFLSATRAKADDFVYAYCPLGEGYVFLYDSPAGFQVLANLKCGQKVTFVGPEGSDRVHVRTADGKEGYVPKSSITGALPGTKQQPTGGPSANTPQHKRPHWRNRQRRLLCKRSHNQRLSRNRSRRLKLK